MLWHVLQAAAAIKPRRIVVVVHNDADLVEEQVRSWELRPEVVFVDQRETLGTGHAVMVAEQALGEVDDVVVLPGDEPLLTGDQLRGLVGIHRRRDVAAVVQTTVPHDPKGFARVVHDSRGEFARLAEQVDATREEHLLPEVATAVYAFRRDPLFAALGLVGTDNRQREYYLPDVLGILSDKGERIAIQLVDNGGAVGANSRAELARAAAVMRRRINDAHMTNGVTFVDPEQTYVDVGVRIGRDTLVLPLTFLEGDTKIGQDCTLGPASRIVDSMIGDGTEVTFSVVRGSRIGREVAVGPYASVRPGTEIADRAKVGSFVEIKGSRVGRGSKVPHLSYVGDAVIGEGANIGAGTVTVNYDGWDKHATVIGDDARIGSDSMLVAPVKVGKRAMTGAGSVITRDVPPGALGISRAEQRNVEGFRDRKEADKTTGRASVAAATAPQRKKRRSAKPGKR